MLRNADNITAANIITATTTGTRFFPSIINGANEGGVGKGGIDVSICINIIQSNSASYANGYRKE